MENRNSSSKKGLVSYISKASAGLIEKTKTASSVLTGLVVGFGIPIMVYYLMDDGIPAPGSFMFTENDIGCLITALPTSIISTGLGFLTGFGLYDLLDRTERRLRGYRYTR